MSKRAKNSAPLATPPFSIVSSKTSHNDSFSQCFEKVAELLNGRKNIIVLLGAGISVSCGIPDFRSRDGLYSILDTEDFGSTLSCAEDLFDHEFFLEDPAPFFKFARNLYFPLGKDKKVEPSDSHKLLALLERNKMLLRVYSQNIDGLESLAGVSRSKIVYAHGNLLQASCLKCQRKVSSEEILPDIIQGTVPRCKAETKSSKKRSGNLISSPSNKSTRASSKGPSQRTRKRQRLSCDDECGGVYKPGVTMFGESLSDSVSRSLEVDRDKVDALIVIGTSLSVAPISKVIEFLPHNIPRILINRTIVHPSGSTPSDDSEQSEESFRENYVFDAYLLGFCDDITRALARQLFKESKDKPNKSDGGIRKDTVMHGGRLLSTVLKGKDADFDLPGWSGLKIPPERIILFPGAVASKDDSSDEVTYEEIVNCDGCSKRIRGEIQKCVDCFDFDLCQKCFPKLSKSHFGGAHSFSSCKRKD